MLDALSAFLGELETGVLALAASAWIYPALLALACIDGFFPPIPSESVIIALGVVATATGNLNLVLILVVAAAGAWAGDQIAFALGRASGTDRLRVLRGERGQRAVAWARCALDRRGAAFIVAGRYVPVGRVAVNMTAGAVGFSRRKFMAISAVAALLWSAYSLLIGLVAGQWLGEAPLLAMVVGIAAGMVMGVVLDQALQVGARLRRRRAVRRVESAGSSDIGAVTPEAASPQTDTDFPQTDAASFLSSEITVGIREPLGSPSRR